MYSYSSYVLLVFFYNNRSLFLKKLQRFHFSQSRITIFTVITG